MKKIIIVTLLLVTSILTYGQNTSEIIIPTFNDNYSEYVKQLEAGQTEIDYQDFRFSFLESEQYKIAKKKSREFSSLKEKMYKEMGNSNYQEVIKITKQMLNIDYTSMLAHKILRQTYQIVNDTTNADKYKTIQFGLLYSIVNNGDGKSCETAWPVIQISEEYFILEMLGAKLQMQSTVNNGGFCDRMDVIIDDEKKIYFFEISKLFEKYSEN